MAVHNDMVVEDVYHRVDPKDSHQPMDAITQVHSGGCQARRGTCGGRLMCHRVCLPPVTAGHRQEEAPQKETE